MDVRGVTGKIMWSYFDAAVLQGFIVTPAPGGVWLLAATVVSTNAYNLSRAPLHFVAPTKAGELRFPVVGHSVAVAGDSLTARLGAPV